MSRMNAPRPQGRLAPAMIVAGVLCIILAAYAGSYLAISRAFSDPAGDIGRTFEEKWQCVLYWPAAKVESAARGVGVYPMYRASADGYKVFPKWDLPNQEKTE